jgi:hypothetical protein
MPIEVGMNEKGLTPPQDAGFITYDISFREGIYEPDFASAEQVQAAADRLPSIPIRGPHDFADRYTVSLSPGSVKIAKQLGDPKPPSAKYKAKSQITEWSRKSRANMVAVLATLDYSPMLTDGLTIPAMLTLTYPNDWETVAPDGSAAQRHLNLFRKRFERKYSPDKPMMALWKMEFQRRGAPHFHLFMVPPADPDFMSWVSETWADVVAHPDAEERRKHVLAGTGLDYSPGLRSTDVKRLSTYFAKHNSSNYSSSKEYQNRPPQLWLDAGKIGRFWGRWGLSPLVAKVEVSHEDAIYASRLLRRWAKANAQPRIVMVPRTNTRTGEIRMRRIRRVPKRMRGTSGFLVVEDGSIMGQLIANALLAVK